MEQYKSILKATSLFGGAQIIQILIQVVRTKLIALLIGASGMGISSMYMSSLTMIITIFGLGINISVVRDLSKANDNNDDYQFALILGVFKRLLLFLALLGTAFVIIMSPLLSEWSFGNPIHIKDYCVLSFIVFFSLLAQGNTAKMVGKRKVKDVAISSLVGSLLMLLSSIPFFYFLGINGIVPGLLVSTFFNYLAVAWFSRKTKTIEITITWKNIKDYGLVIISLGTALVIASLLGNITTYLINVIISKLGNLQDLGLFNAGLSITQQVVSLAFAAMAADYFPRLVNALKVKDEMNDTINQQTEILLYLSCPILSIFLVFSPLIINILLSSEFLTISEFVRILCVGMFFKVISYALGYVSFAKGDKVIYLLFEGGYGNFANLCLSILFYYLWDLRGLAFGFLLHYALYFIFVYLIVKRRYHYSMSQEVIKYSTMGFSYMAILLTLHFLFDGILFYFISIPIVLAASTFCLKILNVKTNFLSTIKSKI